ncbi:MAG TPA: M14 family metallopeptidase [Patescibacteria group bacterium]|nr:M14 family metallopeptidase [Patescibacteria group bacterium]
MTHLSDLMRWDTHRVSAGAAVREIGLSVGHVGEGRPTGLVVAGVHGDEGPWGAWAMRKLLEGTDVGELKGTLRVVPVANPLAMEADERNSPLDSLDLNRAFPGNPTGSHTERLAAVLAAHAVDGADVVIDLHGGGSWCVNSFAFKFPGGEELSKAFGAPFIVEGRERENTLTGYARSGGARVAAVEMGGRCQLEEAWAERIASGLRKALGVAGVLTPSDDEPEKESTPVGASRVLRPSRGGIFKPNLRAVDVGTVVSGGTVMGRLLDPVTMEEVERFEAPFPETAVLLLRPTLARIEGGAMTYVVAPLRKEE